jgi:hypothetical protein
MKKIILSLMALVAMSFLLTGCGQNSKTSGNEQKETSKKEEQKSSGLADVCNYFPKELVEAAIGRPIVKVETSILGKEICNYYTAYSETYDHTPYGDKPGGPQLVVVYDTEDFLKDKASNEKTGSTYTSDSSIGMENFVVKNNINKIWLTALSLGNGVFLRFKAIDDAVTGEELVKIAAKFAEKIK